jgi:molybdopterin synthase catalytic subunit/molybdopterin converting factor small subunit
MHVRIRLFAGLRQKAGTDELALELPEGARVGDALAQLSWLTGDLPVVMALNHDYADPSLALHADDELALIPPVSGGASPAGLVYVRVVDGPLSVGELTERVRDPRAGAIVCFHGITREVPALEYEAYTEMAERKLSEIVTRAVEHHGLCAGAAEHRTGSVGLSEASVIVAASAPHRAEAFSGAREMIDEIKAQAPIWKREAGEWVRGTTPGSPRRLPPAGGRGR